MFPPAVQNKYPHDSSSTRIHPHWCTYRQRVIQQTPAQLRNHTDGSQLWVLSFSWLTSELWQQPHLLIYRSHVSFWKQNHQSPKPSPPMVYIKLPAALKGFLCFKELNKSFFVIFSKHSIRVASLSMTNKNISDTSQQLTSSLIDIFFFREVPIYMHFLKSLFMQFARLQMNKYFYFF